MTASKFWFPKVILVALLIFGGFYFLSKEIPITNVNPPPLVPEVLAESTVTQPLQALTQPTIPVIQAQAVSGTSADYSINLPVLMYHYIRTGVAVTDQLAFTLSVTPEMLDQQLSYLHQQGFQTISLSDLYESLQEGLPLPPKAVVLTFDDGYRDFYTTAFPLLKKYNLRAVNFYIAGYSNLPGYMNWDMLREIQESGLVDVESHTISHPLLTKLSPEEKRKEIFESKRILEEVLGKKINYFAYPYGNYDEQVVNLVNEAGYKLAFSTNPGPLLKSSEKLMLRRVTVSGFDDMNRFIEKLGQLTAQTNLQENVPTETSPTATASPDTNIPQQ